MQAMDGGRHGIRVVAGNAFYFGRSRHQDKPVTQANARATRGNGLVTKLPDWRCKGRLTSGISLGKLPVKLT